MEEYSDTYHSAYLKYRAQFQSYEERLKTFDTWPVNTTSIDSSHIAAAGFYYSQTLDKVYCFHCGGMLHSWAYSDNPYFEHAFWYPRCSFIRQMLGEITMRRIEKEIHSSPDSEVARQHMYKNIVNIGHVSQTNKLVCIICKRNYVNTCLMPCRDTKFCSLCTSQVEKCPICKTEVAMLMKVNL